MVFALPGVNCTLHIHSVKIIEYDFWVEEITYLSQNQSEVLILLKIFDTNINATQIVKFRKSNLSYLDLDKKQIRPYSSYSYRSEQQGQIEYIVIPATIYFTLIVLTAAYVLIRCKLKIIDLYK